MPNRIIREGILTSDRVDQLDAPAEVFYRRLMSKVDDHGLYDARPAVLRSTLYPLRVDRVREADISRSLAACQSAGLIALYQHAGKPYLQMLDTRWQARSEAKYPLPSDDELRAGENTCAQPLATAPVFVVGVGDVDVTPKAPKGADDRFDAFWAVYPAKVGKEAARKAFAKVNPDAALLAAMVAAIAWQARSEKWTKDKGAYIPNPATWLNQGRWQDEPPLDAVSQSGASAAEATQRMLRERAEHAAKATPPPPHILALASRKRETA